MPFGMTGSALLARDVVLAMRKLYKGEGFGERDGARSRGVRGWRIPKTQILLERGAKNGLWERSYIGCLLESILVPLLDRFWYHFGTDFGSILERFWIDFWIDVWIDA